MKKTALIIALIASALLATACEAVKDKEPFVTTTPYGDELYCEYEREDGDWDCEDMD